MEYRVHLFPTVRVALEVQASSQEEALRFAEEAFVKNQRQHLVSAEWDEGPIKEALVDEAGDEEYERSQWYRFDEDGNPQKEE